MTTTSQDCNGVCDFCFRTILTSQRPWGKHHGKAEDLIESARQCCVFCTDLLREARSHFADLEDEFNLPWPLYRWSIHRCVQTRNVTNILSVIFRPLHVCDESDEEEIVDALADKIFYLYHREEDLGDIPSKDELGTTTNSPESWAQIRKWITTCIQSHTQCQTRNDAPTPLPTRLLDVSEIDPDEPDDQPGHMRLVVTEGQIIKGPYTTISHSWGKGRLFITVKAENQEEMMNIGLALGDRRLTNNFRDAIRVTRKLGVNYIWMDSLCILQQNSVDFNKEAPKMHIYYRHTHCNIAAADSTDPDQGLFRTRTSKQGKYPAIPAEFSSNADNKMFGRASWYIVSGDLWNNELLAEPLYKRGWVFQERMLAPRIVHFAKDQIFFECAEMTACESLPNGLLRGLDTRAATDRYWRQRLHHDLMEKSRPVYGSAEVSIEQLWRTSVSTYTRCELTDGNDKLMALSGVATTVGQFFKEVYVDGMWMNRLEEQLAWRVVDLIQANGTPSRRSYPPRCPSWSWASVDGIIELRDRIADREYTIKNHEGGTIVLEGSSTAVKASVPSVLTKESTAKTSNAKGNQIPNEAQAVGIDVSIGQNLNLSSIKLCGFLRESQIYHSGFSGTWSLRITHADDILQNDHRELVKMYLDEVPQKRECHFIVLAYSKTMAVALDELEPVDEDTLGFESDDDANEHQEDAVSPVGNQNSENPSAPTFSGIGLLLDRIANNHFRRIGSFIFDDLFEDELSQLIDFRNTSPQGGHTTDIFLH